MMVWHYMAARKGTLFTKTLKDEFPFHSIMLFEKVALATAVKRAQSGKVFFRSRANPILPISWIFLVYIARHHLIDRETWLNDSGLYSKPFKVKINIRLTKCICK